MKRTLMSSIGSKAVMALTGAALFGFLIVHLSGNLLIFSGPEALSNYALGLRKLGVLLLAARIGLIILFAVHVAIAFKLTFENRRARPQKYEFEATVKATWMSRYMLHTGLVIFAFLAFHLAHYTWRLTDERIGALGPYDVYPMMVMGFQNPLISGCYIVAMLAVWAHLWHGLSSMFQSLGWNHSRYNFIIRLVGPVLGTAISLGNILIPVSVLLGFVK